MDDRGPHTHSTRALADRYRTTVDPGDDLYLDEADVRLELTRVFDVCGGCRRCLDHCDSFPRLFETLDRHPGGDGAGDFTPDDQDRIIDGCVHCGSCAVGCPFSPELVDRSETAVDYPALMIRATAMRRAHRQISGRDRRAARLLAGRSRWSGEFVRRVMAVRAGSPIRRAVAAAVGISSRRSVPVAGRSTDVRSVAGGDRVALMPTCTVMRYAPHLLSSMAAAYARRGIECEIVDIGCCGAPALHAGDRRGVAVAVERVTSALRPHVAAGTPIVVGQSSCARMIRQYAPGHLGDVDPVVVEAVVDAVVDIVDDLASRIADMAPGRADTATDSAPVIVVDRLGAPTPSPTVRLLEALGRSVEEVRGTSGVESIRGWRSANDATVEARMDRLATAISERREPGRVVVSESWLAATAVAEWLGIEVRHPIEILADDDRRPG